MAIAMKSSESWWPESSSSSSSSESLPKSESESPPPESSYIILKNHCKGERPTALNWYFFFEVYLWQVDPVIGSAMES